ncbi:hypothetical protein [Kocuria sp.]|uniref:hypothetical protein n=1 Tax=Kocuria sp. TaxID=1871328 RepID=UPI0026DC27AC|nr:hypothetical protein [Kocuria sp.]MDO4919802.1 hypothetical protein [Kocuria sp.]
MTVTPDSRPTLQIRRAEDLLALVPHQLGHEPRNASVLFLPAPEGRALCLSMDTPGPGADLSVLGDELLDVLLRVPHCGEAVVVVYSDREPARGHTCDLRAPRAWQSVLEHLGLEVLRILVVGPAHWWDHAEPSRPMPVQLIRDSAVSAQLVALGSALEPVALREDPAWCERLRARGHELLRALNRSGGEPRTGAPADAHHTAGAAVAPGSLAPTGPPAALAAWWRAVERVASDREHWVAAVLDTPVPELRTLLDALLDDATRDALLYAWLTGSTERAGAALTGLRAAVSRLRVGRATAPETPAGAVEEALRCLTAVSGEWDGPPHWDTLDSAYRVLQVLDGLLVAGEPASEGESAAARGASAAVVAVLAQLEQYRGRSRTAAGLLDAGTESSRSAPRGRSAAGDVRRRLAGQAAPWWCADPRTSWPGRHAWSRGAVD